MKAHLITTGTLFGTLGVQPLNLHGIEWHHATVQVDTRLAIAFSGLIATVFSVWAWGLLPGVRASRRGYTGPFGDYPTATALSDYASRCVRG